MSVSPEVARAILATRALGRSRAAVRGFNRRPALGLLIRMQAPPGRNAIAPEVWQSIGNSLMLTERELQIVQCIFDDQKQLAIGREVGISPHTVHTYIERLYRKLNVSSRSQLIIRVFTECMWLDGDAATSQDDHGHGAATGTTEDAADNNSPPRRASRETL